MSGSIASSRVETALRLTAESSVSSVRACRAKTPLLAHDLDHHIDARRSHRYYPRFATTPGVLVEQTPAKTGILQFRRKYIDRRIPAQHQLV
jgi:hypothetical protein